MAAGSDRSGGGHWPVFFWYLGRLVVAPQLCFAGTSGPALVAHPDGWLSFPSVLEVSLESGFAWYVSPAAPATLESRRMALEAPVESLRSALGVPVRTGGHRGCNPTRVSADRAWLTACPLSLFERTPSDASAGLEARAGGFESGRSVRGVALE